MTPNATICRLHMRAAALCLCCVLLTLLPSIAQQVKVEYLGIEQGLSNNAVTCIQQDSKGFMWFGTYDGLNRYDGYHFKTFRNKLNDTATLIDNRIVAIGEDAHNNIWVGTKKGLSIYCNIREAFFPAYVWHEGKKQKITQPVNDIKKATNHNMFVAAAGIGLLQYKAGDTAPAHTIPLHIASQRILNYHAQAISFDARGQLWVFVQGYGLCKYAREADEIQLVNSRIYTGNCLLAGNEDTVWLGSEIGLVMYNVRLNTVQVFDEGKKGLSARKVVGLCLDKQQQLWIATDGGGVNILHIPTGTFSWMLPGQDKNTITSAAIYAIYEDKESRKWIGTLRGGINVIDKQKNRFVTISRDPLQTNSLVNDFILSFCEDEKNNIWIGTDGGGVSCWNRHTQQYTSFKHEADNTTSLSNNYATSIVKDYRNDIWIATYGAGINKYDAATKSFKRYACYNAQYHYEDWYVWKLYEDKRHQLWAGTCASGRLYRYNREADRFEVFDDQLADVITLAEDNLGNLWAGTFNKLIRIDAHKKQHRVYEINFPVRFFHQDKAGRYWVGTEGGGVLQLNPATGQWTVLSETEGLASNSALNMLEDSKGNLWISTFNGLSCLQPATGRFTNFYGSDGLQTNQFNYNAALALQSGAFLFGGIKGFNLFYPDSVQSTCAMPDLLLTGMHINNQPAANNKTYFTGSTSIYDVTNIRLPYDKAVLSVDFAALEYSAPDKITYAYYLEGWDKDWSYGKLKTANYSRLHEGKYTLHIKCTNAEGVWSSKERLIAITVLPPWYRSWWAWVLYGAVAFAAIRMYLLYQKKQARLTYEVELAHLEVEKEKELNEKKLSFFTNISHEFRSPLTLIINPVKELLCNTSKEADAENLRVVHRNARRLLSLVDQLLLFRKADSQADQLHVAPLNFYELCYEVYLCFIQQAKNRQIEYEFSCDNALLEIYADREKMEIALFNLVANALKFTPDGGKVLLHVTEAAQQVQVLVTDTGCGISAEAGRHVFDKFYQDKRSGKAALSGFGIGLYLVKHFVEHHAGNISYRNNTEGGATFCVQLLKGKAHFKAEDIIAQDVAPAAGLQEWMQEEEMVVAEETALNEPAEALVSDAPLMLVIDDNQEVRQYIGKLFKKRFHLHEAENAEQGLQLVKQLMPDIIISDVVMPGISGIELCNQLKADKAFSHIPLVLLTASTSASVKLKGVACGADDYITKPFEKELLEARVEALLKSRNNLQQYFFNEITLQPHNLKISGEYKDFLDRCIAIVEQHIDNEEFSIKTLSTAIGMSHSNLYKKVKAISGQTVNGFIRYIRLRRAAELFINSSCNVNEAAIMVGINDSKYFREQFYKLFGSNPSDYIRKYRKSFQKTYRLDGHVVRMPATAIKN
ncbi:Signal transduction histidine kinase [Filimonas lacunae]|uniref:histidine kinase n=1 Tax=Filimonas lacunae TaxID=477680 RepID=A0A173MPS5_9BACT|nr:two-component regulator propeller domain-containing protein [Filimonas lacunae]BAV09467.1 two-component hybrid sensor and regulator [Filimonas lacunae]SIS73704.1 Signal transduction histidine kinase [Filimonas lacunae]